MYRPSYHLTPASNRGLVYATLYALPSLSISDPSWTCCRGSAPLSSTLGIVVLQVAFQICLHLLYRLIPGYPPLDTAVFINQGAYSNSIKPQLCGPRTLVVSRPQNSRPLYGSMIDQRLVGFEKWQHCFVGVRSPAACWCRAVSRRGDCNSQARFANTPCRLPWTHQRRRCRQPSESQWRLRHSWLKSSNWRICSSLSSMTCSWWVFSRRSKRSCLKSRSWRCTRHALRSSDVDTLQSEFLRPRTGHG